MRNLLRNASSVVLMMMLSLCCATFTSCSSDDDEDSFILFEWDNVCFNLSEGKYSQIEICPNGMYVLWTKEKGKSDARVSSYGEYKRTDNIYQLSNATLEVREYTSESAVIAYTPAGGQTEIYKSSLGERLKKTDKHYYLFSNKWKPNGKLHVQYTYKGRVVFDEFHSLEIENGMYCVNYNVKFSTDERDVEFMTTFIGSPAPEVWYSMSGLEFAKQGDYCDLNYWKWKDMKEGSICNYFPNDPELIESSPLYIDYEEDCFLLRSEKNMDDIVDGFPKGVCERCSLYYSPE